MEWFRTQRGGQEKHSKSKRLQPEIATALYLVYIFQRPNKSNESRRIQPTENQNRGRYGTFKVENKHVRCQVVRLPDLSKGQKQVGLLQFIGSLSKPSCGVWSILRDRETSTSHHRPLQQLTNHFASACVTKYDPGARPSIIYRTGRLIEMSLLNTLEMRFTYAGKTNAISTVKQPDIETARSNNAALVG